MTRLTDWQLTAHIIGAIRGLQNAPPPTEEQKGEFDAWDADWQERLAATIAERDRALAQANNLVRLATNPRQVQEAVGRANAATATLQEMQKELNETLNAALVAGLVDGTYMDPQPEGPVV